MARRGAIRPGTSPWLIAGVLDLAARLQSGHQVLRKITQEPLLFENFALGTFLTQGLVISLNGVSEALTILEEIAPCVGDIKGQYESDLKNWSMFRDDAAYIIDRGLRAPAFRAARLDNDAALNPNAWDWEEGTLVVGYDSLNDRIVTGTIALDLGKAIERAADIYGLVSKRVSEETGKGNIAAPVNSSLGANC